MDFCYTLNASCFGNKEFDPTKINSIMEELELIGDIGVDSVAVTIPSLIEMVKTKLPGVRVKASVINQIGSVHSVKYFTEHLGVGEICIGIDNNRDFKLLEAMRKATPIKLEILANEDCLFHCPYRAYHYNMQSHGSKKDDQFGGRYIDYCVMKCIKHRVLDHKEIIKARFVRPEDVKYYEEIGIDSIKISARHLPSEWGMRSVKAYSERKYEGNLGDIISPIAMSIPEDSLHRIKHWSEEEWEIMKATVSTPAPNIYIDNRKLDGFLEHFRKKKNSCDQTLCGEECEYCGKIAEKAITADPNQQLTDDYILLIDEMLKMVTTGSLVENNLWSTPEEVNS
ncbi:MAG: hypothetical protein GY714_06250 [Desulfobacterales bacterium]|nr:hypothetical protein [Desulfobacterales bacterium]